MNGGFNLRSDRSVNTVAINTYCKYTSYGSMLQCFALTKVLENLGVDSFLVNEWPHMTAEKYAELLFPFDLTHLRYWLFYTMHKNLLLKQYTNSQRFVEDNIKISYFNGYEAIKSSPPVADLYLSGSDQVFHPDQCNPLFFLDYVDDKDKKVSYAASMGKIEIADGKRKEFERLLKSFSSISIREDDAAKVISECLNRNVEVHIDPTFLINKEDWRKIAMEYPVSKPYVLVYPLFWDKSLNKELRSIHNKYDIDVITVGNSYTNAFATKHIWDASVQQFLWLIDNAQAVITSSFHGVSLSTILNKKVSIVVDPNSSSRLNSLIHNLGLSVIPICDVLRYSFDYSQVNQRIVLEQERSDRYFKEILGK